MVRRGLCNHSDSVGAAARYGEGDVQWLTAGGGILHSEMFPLVEAERPNPLELFQIWLNLPRAQKMVEPHFSMLWSGMIPHKLEADAQGRAIEVTIIAGRYGELRAPPPPPASWASHADADVAIWTIKLGPGASWTLPVATVGSNRALYFFRGSGLRAGGRDIPASHEIVLRPEREVALQAGADEAELLLLQGRPIGEPVVAYGPFVMNTREEIQQTFADYQRTQFGGWPWPSAEPVHPREEPRFARHADGRVERPGSSPWPTRPSSAFTRMRRGTGWRSSPAVIPSTSVTARPGSCGRGQRRSWGAPSASARSSNVRCASGVRISAAIETPSASWRASRRCSRRTSWLTHRRRRNRPGSPG